MRSSGDVRRCPLERKRKISAQASPDAEPIRWVGKNVLNPLKKEKQWQNINKDT